MIQNHHCRVCGYDNETLPWGEDGTCPTYEYCPCCGVEFGNQDYTIESVKEFRGKWISEGAQWDDLKEKPTNWNLEEQLRNIPEKFI